MARSKKLDPAVVAHLEWLGFVRPTGLVVSAPAMVRAGAVLNRSDSEGQRLLRDAATERSIGGSTETQQVLWDFQVFAKQVLGWSFRKAGYAGTDDSPIPAELVVPLSDFDETLQPDFAVRELEPDDGASPWQLLVRVLETGQDFDKVRRGKGGLEASEHGRMERLLRRTGVTAGLLCNGRAVRLISAPRGESSGHLDFGVDDMLQTAGRPIAAAMRLLLSEQRLLSLSKTQRLAALLDDSRKFQNTVSEKLAEQVLHALYELMRGFQRAHDDSQGALLRDVLDQDPEDVYRGLLTVLLRMVFLLYAEERDMLPGDEAFVRYYSLAGLHERLQEDAALHPDTMDQRYGAWAQLLNLFRMVHDGATAEQLKLPPRHGALLDPDRFPFLEGRPSAGARQVTERIDVPLVSDGTVYRALEDLLVLDGERISYRALDVEQIGSVYETMMGFRVETATGTSVAVKADKKGGAPTTIDLDALLAQPPAKRSKWLTEHAHRKLPTTVTSAVKDAASIDDLDAALTKVRDRAATPDLVAKGSLVLQPSEARRKSGSHYTPRELTEPIVRTTLQPILDRLREEAEGPPTTAQILDLKVCDPAMGSGAFLVEACRQLGDALIEAWEVHGDKPEIPADEDEIVHARRLVAQRCIYGVDRNPMAVNLAKLSLWLTTLAREHAFTFLDHALRHGDSLVGLSNAKIAALDWSDEEPIDSPKYRKLKAQIDDVVKLRRQIREAGDDVSDWELRDLLDEAEHKASEVRTWGDLVIEAFFSADKDKARRQALSETAKGIALGVKNEDRARLDIARRSDPPLAPFHWELVFPEVFDRERPGMDAFVGNPPYAGKNTVSAGNVSAYGDWLKTLHVGSHGNADLVAHMFRRSYTHLRRNGTMGLIATRTISKGDTRTTGLKWMRDHGAYIYAVTSRLIWPGMASRIVSIIHAKHGPLAHAALDGRPCKSISSYLTSGHTDEDPAPLMDNASKSFIGTLVLGMGFTFDDTDQKNVASSLNDMHQAISANPRCREVIRPLIGFSEVASHPQHQHHRFVISFGERNEDECRARWPELMRIVEERVKPGRLNKKDNPTSRRRKKFWWQFGGPTPGLDAAASHLERVIVAGSQASKHFVFAFLDSSYVFTTNLTVIAADSFSAFASLQAQIHEVWSRFFMTPMKDDLVYTPTTCFNHFPFPDSWQNQPSLEAAGQAYHDFRAELMVETDLGLTKTYNRFHDPDEDDPKIVRLRELHAAMDRAVLDAYGWSDIPTDCEFLLDYEDEDDDGSSHRKKPWRYRWPDEVRDRVLARLLELNAQRAKEEAGGTSEQPTGTPQLPFH